MNIQWYHSTPRSPMKNSLVEIMVKLIKRPLYKVMGDHPLTQSDLVTLLSDCQASVNSRSLGYLSDDPKNDNFLPLTPAHLVLGRGITPIPHELYHSMHRLSPHEHWSQRITLANRFFNTWKKTYLMKLRDLTRSKANSEGIKEGSIVLLLDEKITPRSWPIAIVDEIIPTRSSDKPRSVFLRLPLSAKHIDNKGRQRKQPTRLKRGVERLVLLESAYE